ncbi:MAG: cutinase family protein [Rhodococcus sp. (in: high G+C Gram-positive bacteria)]
MVLLTAFALAATVSVSAAGRVSAAPATASSCPSTFNLFVPGTWETSENADPAVPVGMLAPIANAITAHNPSAQVYFLAFMARAFDNGHTYGDSKADGTTRATSILVDIAASCPNTYFTITGYSQGADIAGDLASKIGNGSGPIPAEKVLAVGLLADPGSGTTGEATVGPRASGNGIADPRPAGMGALSGRVASICDPADMYCSIKKGTNPVLGTLGSVLSKATTTGEPSTSASGVTPTGDAGSSTASGNAGFGGAAGPDAGRLASALTSDFSKADLPALGTQVNTLRDQVASGTVDPASLASTASSIANTVSPLAELISSGAANTAATSTLAAAPAGSPQHSAAAVLDGAARSDLSGAAQTATSIASTASTLATTATTGGTATSAAAQADGLLDAAVRLTGQVAPLTGTNTDALSSALPVLSTLKPSVVLDQALNVATGVTSLNVPAILDGLSKLPARVAALDAQGAHKIAGDLNNAFAPLVKMAAGVDLSWVSQVLSVIPDPSGYTQIAAMVVNILGRVDVIKLANIVGQIQEIAWAAVEKLLPPGGGVPDLAGAAAAMTGLLPLGLDLASVAVGMLTGKVSKTSPQLLGTQSNESVTSITDSANKLDLAGLTGSLTQMASSPGADDLATLVSDGLTAATFFASGAHQSYGSMVVDNAGRNAIDWLSDWLKLQIERVAA